MINDYDRFAKERQEQLKKGEKRPHRFIEKPMMRELLINLTGKRVLMLGCGTGEENIMLREFGATDIVGIDLSEESIKLWDCLRIEESVCRLWRFRFRPK